MTKLSAAPSDVPNIFKTASFSLQEVRSLRAKHRPHRLDEQIQYKPAVGRDTNSGPLVATKVCVCPCVCVCVCVSVRFSVCVCVCVDGYGQA